MNVVERSDSAAVATLTLNRPEKLNAITPEMVSLLRAHLDDIAAGDDIACVVLRGAGRCFSAGADLAGVGAPPEPETSQNRYAAPKMIDLLESLPQTTIAAVHGYCFTGALELALGCDLIVAAESAVLGDTHGRYGLVPVWGASVRLAERVGVSRAKQIVLTGRRLDATAAERMGLVNEVWPDSEFDHELERLAADVCAQSRGSNARFKRLLHQDPAGRTLRLAFERTRPWGLPEDFEERRRSRSSSTTAVTTGSDRETA